MPEKELTMKISMIVSVAATAVLFGIAAHADPVGTWLTDSGKSRVKIETCGSGLCGRIVWLRNPVNAAGEDMRDTNNADESLRERKLIGIELMSGFTEARPGRWTGGRIYNPEDGRTYDSRLVEQDESTLTVKGCVLFICKSQTWTRVPQDETGDSN